MTKRSEGLSHGDTWRRALQAEETDSANALRWERASYVCSTEQVGMTGAERDRGRLGRDEVKEGTGGQMP